MPIYLSKDIKHYCVASASWRRHKRLEEIIEALKTAQQAQTINVEMDGGEFGDKK